MILLGSLGGNFGTFVIQRLNLEAVLTENYEAVSSWWVSSHPMHPPPGSVPVTVT